jgi:hypothetical protein
MDQNEVTETLRLLRQGQSQLMATLESLSSQMGVPNTQGSPSTQVLGEPLKLGKSVASEDAAPSSNEPVIRSQFAEDTSLPAPATPTSPTQKSALTQRIILTCVATRWITAGTCEHCSKPRWTGRIRSRLESTLSPWIGETPIPPSEDPW